MLRLPETGVVRSVASHNCDREALVDWIEASVLYTQESASLQDYMDVLLESGIYDSQEFAWEEFGFIWDRLRNRIHLMGIGSPFNLKDQMLIPRVPWQDAPGPSFCLLLSLGRWYEAWRLSFGHDFTDQGVLFELLAEASLRHGLPGWTIHRVGWDPQTEGDFGSVAQEVAKRLNEGFRGTKPWIDQHGNDRGLDLLIYRPYGDRRAGLPTFLVQCASGVKWSGKANEPNIRFWSKLVDFLADPTKTLVIPHAISDSEFLLNCPIVEGPLIERFRLLDPGKNTPDWVPEDLTRRIIQWSEPRVDRLPFLT